MVTGFLLTFPIRAELQLMRGDAYVRALGLRTAAGLVDTAGWYGLLQVRDAAGTVKLEASTANSRIVMGIQGTAPNQWNLLINIPKAVMTAVPDLTGCEWQLEAGPASASSVTYFGGPVTLTPDKAF
jgi:hypothetical protein